MWILTDMNQNAGEISLDHLNYLKEKGIREGQNLEFKLKYKTECLETICAFANSNGGWLILGIQDDGNEKIREILGCSDDFIENFRKQFRLFDPYFEWDYIENMKALPFSGTKTVYILKIPPSRYSIKYKGRYFIRIANETIGLNFEKDIIELKKRKGELDTQGKEFQRYCHLPEKEYASFIGRDIEFQKILEELQGHHHIVSIDGIGGVGKSTLALELAYYVYERRIFDCVLWFSGKKEKLTITNITPIDPEFSNLEELLERIGNEIHIQNFNQFSDENKSTTIVKMLAEHSVLLVIDNLETIDLNERFIDFLSKVCGMSRVLITSRKRIGQLERIIKLPPFTQEDCDEFINQEVENRTLILSKPLEVISSSIFEITGGIPLAIKVMLGWLNQGISIDKLKEKVQGKREGILEFCFEETFREQLPLNAKTCFLVISILPNNLQQNTLNACIDLKLTEIEEAINELLNFSLISREADSEEESILSDTIKMLPLTRLFAYGKIGEFKNLERKTQQKYHQYIESQKQYLTELSARKSEIELAGLTQPQQLAYLKAITAKQSYEQGDIPRAMNLFKEATKLADDIPEIYLMQAEMEKSLGHIRATDELYATAIKLDPENPSIWAMWAAFFKQIKAYSRAKEILFAGIKSVSVQKAHLLRRELSIILNYLEEFQQAIAVLENNFIENPSKEDEFILNTKNLSSILQTFYNQAKKWVDSKHYEMVRLKYLDAMKMYEKYKTLAKEEEPSLQYRIHQIKNGLGMRYAHENFMISIQYYHEAFFLNPRKDREIQHNKWVIRNLKYLLSHWAEIGLPEAVKLMDENPEKILIKRSDSEIALSKDLESAIKIIKEIIEQRVNEEKELNLTGLKSDILKKETTFNEGKFDFQRFYDFVNFVIHKERLPYKLIREGANVRLSQN